MELSTTGAVQGSASPPNSGVRRTNGAGSTQLPFADLLNIAAKDEDIARGRQRSDYVNPSDHPKRENRTGSAVRTPAKKAHIHRQANQAEKTGQDQALKQEGEIAPPHQRNDVETPGIQVNGQSSPDVAGETETGSMGAASAEQGGSAEVRPVESPKSQPQAAAVAGLAGSTPVLTDGKAIAASDDNLAAEDQAAQNQGGQAPAAPAPIDAGKQQSIPAQAGSAQQSAAPQPATGQQDAFQMGVALPGMAQGLTGLTLREPVQSGPTEPATVSGSNPAASEPSPAPTFSVSAAQVQPGGSNPSAQGQSGGTAEDHQSHRSQTGTAAATRPTGSVQEAQAPVPAAAVSHLNSTAGSSEPLSVRSNDTPLQDQQVIQQILKQLEPAIRSGRNSLHIQLQPESLGRIDLRLTSSEQGIAVTFRASQPGTQAALENNLGDLRQALNNAGIQLNHLGVGPQGQSNSGTMERHNSFTPGYGGQKSSSAEPEIVSSERIWKPASTVDYRA